MVYERTKRAAKDFEDHIEISEYRTLDKDVQREWGITDAVFVDGKEIRTGPPASYKKIRKIIERRVRALK